MSDPIYFEDREALREWFRKNQNQRSELILGYYKKHTQRPSVSWSESVEEALCFGWIDSVRRTIDEDRWCIRMTPRRPKSHWSRVNIESVERLKEAGLMTEAGLRAWASRDPSRSAQAAYEKPELELEPAYVKLLRSNPPAWKFFQDLAPGYRRTTIHWVMGAKREATRDRRARILLECCSEELKIPSLRRNPKS